MEQFLQVFWQAQFLWQRLASRVGQHDWSLSQPADVQPGHCPQHGYLGQGGRGCTGEAQQGHDHDPVWVIVKDVQEEVWRIPGVGVRTSMILIRTFYWQTLVF